MKNVRWVFIRNNGMGWFVRHRTLGWNKHLVIPDPARERIVEWRGDCITTLVAFLASEVRALAPEVEVAA